MWLHYAVKITRCDVGETLLHTQDGAALVLQGDDDEKARWNARPGYQAGFASDQI
jgi:hypothetical protein